jgi:hypothetical protein
MIVYLLLTAGLWMFLYSFTLSGSNMTGVRVPPAGFAAGEGKAELHLADAVFTADLSLLGMNSDMYLAAYLLSPDELRAEVYAIVSLLP